MKKTRIRSLLLLAAALALFAGCSGKKTVYTPRIDSTPTDGLALTERPKESGLDAPGLADFRANVSTIHFDYNKYEIRADQIPVLEKNAAYLKSNSGVRVVVEGHCDKRGTTEYNFALGERRADAVRQFLAKRGVAPSRVAVLSKGSEEPFAQGETEEVFAQNRRVEFKMGVQAVKEKASAEKEKESAAPAPKAKP